MKKFKLIFSIILFQLLYVPQAQAKSSPDWLTTLYAHILTCDQKNSPKAKGIFKIMVFANAMDWFENKKIIKGYFLWQDKKLPNEDKKNRNSVMFPVEITRNADSFIVNSTAEWAYSGYLTVDNIGIGEAKVGIYYRPEDNANFTYTCFRYIDPK